MQLVTFPTEPENTATMSSLDIAAITEKEHAHVMRDIRNVLDEAGIGLSKFGSSYRNAQNKEQPCYQLPRRECDLVISGYSVTYRLAIIDRWRELENKQSFQLPASFAEALRLAADQAEVIAIQNGQLAVAAPKVEFYDTVTESATDCSMATAAQILKLGYGSITLFRKLREMGVLISGGSRHNMPKQRYIEQGLFTVSESSYTKEKETVMTFTTLATQKGMSWILRNLGKKELSA